MAGVKAKPAKKKARTPELEHFYYWASGLTAEACCFVGIRCEAGSDGPPDGGESWLLAAHGGKVELVHGTERPLIAAYRAPTGEMFTVDDVGNTARFDGKRRTERSLPAKMTGIWGLDAKRVFAWGFARDGTYPVFRWDGRAWSPMGKTDFPAMRVHGSSRDDLWAAGWNGHTARWDGKRWIRVEAPVEDKLTGLWCESPTERYAVGKDGALLVGDAEGWSEVASTDYSLQAVAKWRGTVWVCAGADGLMRLDGKKLKLVKHMLAYDLDARGDLLVLAPGAIHHTTDGKKFRSIGKDELERLRGDTPLGVPRPAAIR